MLIGYGLGLILYDYLASLGELGRILGFGIALVYLGVMNSRICGGQTLGKKVTKIKVVSSNGTGLTVAASFCRAIFCMPLFLMGANFFAVPIQQQSWFVVILTLLTLGVSFSDSYLFTFNPKTRQSLHDLAVGSYVIRTGAETVPLTARALWRGHFVVIVVFMALATAALISVGRLSETEPGVSILLLQKTLASEPGVRYVKVVAGSTWSASAPTGLRHRAHHGA